MKQEVKSTIIVCDSCGKRYKDGNGMVCYLGDMDGSGIEMEALDSGWERIGNKHYCPDCHSIGENDNIVTADGKVFDSDTEQEIVGIKESPLRTFPRVNMFDVGASYRH